jgi:hypothetical protein
MSRRMLEFPPDRPMGASMGALGDLPPADGSAAHARAVGNIKADLGARAARLDESVEVLLQLVQRHDPLQLIPSISVLTSSVTWAEGTRIDDGDQTFSWEAKIEYLAGLALAGPRGDADVGEDVTLEAIELTATVFDATQAGLFLWSVEDGVTDDPTLDLTSYMMQVEHLVDRMRGYAVHLEEVSEAVFEPRRSLYLDVLGFCPSDVVRLVRRHNGWVNAEAHRLGPLLASVGSMGDEGQTEVAHAFKYALDAVCLWSPDLLAQSTGLPHEEVEAMLTLMSTEFGSQPEFRVPGDENILRKRPFIRSSDVFLVPMPWAPAHCIHDWLLDYLNKEPNPRLRDAYFKGRSDAAERLVHSSLATIFGDSPVHANVHYDGASGHGEVDCLVGRGTPVVVEVKSQSVTDPGRRGNRARLERVTKEILERSSDQTGKASDYIIDGGRLFASNEGAEARQLLHDTVCTPIQIVVSFEGIDPLSISISALTKSEVPRTVWVTDLADFLVVRDILGDPGPFLHYAKARSDPSRPAPYMETDALVSYLEDRLTASPESAVSAGPPALLLHYNSGLINDYYTKLELGYPAERLGLGIPDEIREVLRVTGVKDNSILWWQVASAVLEMTPADWAKWKHFGRRNRADRLFTLPAQDVGIVLSSTAAEPEIVAGVRPTLAVPMLT